LDSLRSVQETSPRHPYQVEAIHQQVETQQPLLHTACVPTMHNSQTDTRHLD
jgi:hypothetical protein